MADNWKQLNILTSQTNFELVTNALIIQGITGIENLPQDQGLAIYLPATQLTAEWCEHLQQTLKDLGLAGKDYQVQLIADVDWQWGNKWAPYYRPVRISHFMSIIPSWQKQQVASPYDILMDPQESFGSGDHPTTKLCLQALTNIVNQQDSLIDVGTGSGILAIAAAKFGINNIWGYDISAAAIKVAEKNFKLNCPQAHFQGQVNSLLDNVDQSADIITANMLEEPIRQLIPQLFQHLHEHGCVIISGILAQKLTAIIQLLQDQHFQLLQTSTAQGWGCFIAQKEQ